MTTVEEPSSGIPEGNCFDERWEFNAPRFHDFVRGTPCGEQPDSWFDTSATKGEYIRRCLAVVRQLSVDMRFYFFPFLYRPRESRRHSQQLQRKLMCA